MKKATLKPATAAEILKAHGVSKKREAEILARYAAALEAGSKQRGAKTPKAGAASVGAAQMSS
jgi:hypothetical protein